MKQFHPLSFSKTLVQNIQEYFKNQNVESLKKEQKSEKGAKKRKRSKKAKKEQKSEKGAKKRKMSKKAKLELNKHWSQASLFQN